MVLSAYKGFHCQHRSDDFVSIRRIVDQHCPAHLVELGTDEGGFAAFLADTSLIWGGRVTTFDIEMKFDPSLVRAFENLSFVRDDVLGKTSPKVYEILRQPSVMLYCDNGNKKLEIERYAKHLFKGSLLGVHDYGTEVEPEWCEGYLRDLGFEPEGHAIMEALQNEYYEPMSRFWVRVRT